MGSVFHVEQDLSSWKGRLFSRSSEHKTLEAAIEAANRLQVGMDERGNPSEKTVVVRQERHGRMHLLHRTKANPAKCQQCGELVASIKHEKTILCWPCGRNVEGAIEL